MVSTYWGLKKTSNAILSYSFSVFANFALSHGFALPLVKS